MEMKKRRLVLVLAVVLAAVTVNATVITGPPITGFLTTDGSKDVALSASSSSFSADLSSYAAWVGSVSAIGGYYGAQGIADLRHEDGPGFMGNIDRAYVMVGSGANSRTGYFVYKFVVEPSLSAVTGEGGAITMDVWFNGAPTTQGEKMWVGVCGNLTIGGTNMYIANGADFNRVNMKDKFVSSVSANYTGTVTLDIPVGVTTFYVAMEDAGSSGRLAMTSLSVDAVLVPEPATVLLLACGAITLRRRMKK